MVNKIEKMMFIVRRIKRISRSSLFKILILEIDDKFFTFS